MFQTTSVVQNLESELPSSGKFRSRISEECWDVGDIHFEHVDSALERLSKLKTSIRDRPGSDTSSVPRGNCMM
jgi:hypothetical protein